MKPKYYCVYRKWKEARDIQILEYFGTLAECRMFMSYQVKSPKYKLGIGKWI